MFFRRNDTERQRRGKDHLRTEHALKKEGSGQTPLRRFTQPAFRRAICLRQGGAGDSTEKAKSRGSGFTAAAVFLRQKQPGLHTCRDRQITQALAVILTSRLISCRTAFSDMHPMTGFRPVRPPPRLQWRYRSGFAPDSLFSPAAHPAPKALSWLFTFANRIPQPPPKVNGNPG